MKYILNKFITIFDQKTFQSVNILHDVWHEFVIMTHFIKLNNTVRGGYDYCLLSQTNRNHSKHNSIINY